MAVLWALVKKEWLLLARDWHALLLLFVMPAFFILIMSLALRDRFSTHSRVELSYYLVDEDQQALSKALTLRLKGSAEFRLLEDGAPLPALEARVQADQAHFLVRIPAGFSRDYLGKSPMKLKFQAGPGVEPALFELFAAALRGELSRLYLTESLKGLERKLAQLPAADQKAAKPQVDLDAAASRLEASYLSAGAQRPSAVQQNVPAWLLFAMFFIGIPLSSTWVQERQLGTFARLKTMGISPWALLAGKLLPYYLINLVQVVLLLAVGVWLVPALGGDRLGLGRSPAGLALVTLSVSFASVSYAMLIANLVKTVEQATIFTGVSNLLLAALGGIMVPRFLMPTAMQDVSLLSPMAWGLEGFLSVFLRQGGPAEAAPWVARLLVFGLASLGLAVFAMRRQRGK